RQKQFLSVRSLFVRQKAPDSAHWPSGPTAPKLTEISAISPQALLFHLVAVGFDRQLGDSLDERPALLLGVDAAGQGTDVLCRSRIGIVDAFPVERAHCQNDHLKSVQTKTARFSGLPLQEYKQMKDRKSVV